MNFALGHWSFAAAAARPNIIFILADDLGWGDLHCYGHPYSKTPNLDGLARDGTRFQQFYATGVTCCPSRTGFMTSKFPATYPIYPANGGFANHVTVTELLKKSGYHTGHFGKWHIGPDQKNGTYGIDEVGGDDAVKRTERKNPRGRDAHIYDQAIQFIEKNKAGPFYMNVWSHISHFPVDPPQSYVERFREMQFSESDFASNMHEKFDRARKGGQDPGECMRRYLADVNSLDEDVGRLLKKLDELGLRDNTIVVFSSDQGAPGIDPNADEAGDANPKKKGKAGKIWDLSVERLNMMGYGGGLRGGKHNMYEGGVRIPFIIRWPGHTPAGRVDEKSVVSGIDWLPTVCAVAGVNVGTTDLDGEDASSSWLGKDFTRTKPLLWKISNPKADVGIREGPWKLIYSDRRRSETELYDLSHDSGEKQNVAAKNPDVVKKLTAKIEAWNSKLPKEYVKTRDKDN